jgi:hypothetical protein
MRKPNVKHGGIVVPVKFFVTRENLVKVAASLIRPTSIPTEEVTYRDLMEAVRICLSGGALQSLPSPVEEVRANAEKIVSNFFPEFDAPAESHEVASADPTGTQDEPFSVLEDNPI